MKELRNRRILLIDDNPSIHEDFQKILTPDTASAANIDLEAKALLGEERVETPQYHFTLDSAFQGQEALAKIEDAKSCGEPHAMAFVDMRMPPGWDGLETIRRIWQVQPDLETVICTAYSDHSWHHIQNTLGESDRLLILKKPFDKVEVQQLALNLTEKWNLRRLAKIHSEGLGELVRSRTQELERAHQSKSDFLTNLSHELLTPMHGIVGLAELLADTSLNPDQAELLHDLRNSAERLHQLLDYVIQFNDLTSGRAQPKSSAFELAPLCENVIADYGAKATQKALELKLAIHPSMRGEIHGFPKYLRQALALLLDNAVKFSDREYITLAVEPGESDQNVEFRVSDQGAGIPPERLALLRHPFSQASGGLSRRAEGIGMGLTLTRQLANLMGGWMEIQSTTRQGSTFTLTLPLAVPIQSKAA